MGLIRNLRTTAIASLKEGFLAIGAICMLLVLAFAWNLANLPIHAHTERQRWCKHSGLGSTSTSGTIFPTVRDLFVVFFHFYGSPSEAWLFQCAWVCLGLPPDQCAASND